MEQLERIKQQNRARQKAYYERHKIELNKKRREIYAECAKKKHVEQHPTPSSPSPTSISKIDFNKSKKVTYEEVIHALEQIIDKKGSLTIYKDSLKRLLKLTNCADDILKCLKNHKKILEAIETSDYSTNTKKTLYQMILKVIDTLHLSITPKVKEQYIKSFNEYKYLSNENTKKKQEEESVIPFDEYIEKVKETFGIHSKMFLLANLYKEIPIRDDFILKIVSTMKKAETDEDEDVNYIVINKKDDATLIIYNHKTDGKFTEIKEKLSKYLSRLIRDYRQQENIGYGDYLFGKSNLSKYLSDSNKKMGIKGGGVNIIRQMKVSDLSENATASERVALADKMKHGILTQQKYKRKQNEKKIDLDLEKKSDEYPTEK